MRNLLCALMAAMTLFSYPLFAKTPEPYHSIHVLPFDGSGSFIHASQLETCLRTLPAKVVIEVGGGLGSSTRFIAQTIGDKGKVYAIDLWNPDEDTPDSYPYQQFLSNTIHAKLTDTIIPLRMESSEAAKTLDCEADLIYLNLRDIYEVEEFPDEENEENTYHEIIAWHPHLETKGILCGTGMTDTFLRLGIERAAADLQRSVQSDGDFWRFVKN